MTTLDPTTIGTISAIGAAVIPPLVSFLKRQTWSAQVKQLVAALAALIVAGVGIAVTTQDFTTLAITQLAALAYAGSQVVYGVYFRGSAVETRLRTVGVTHPAPAPAIEQPQTPGP